MEGVEASSNKKWGNRECGRSGCAEGQTSARPVSPPSLLARARAHAVGAPDASSANHMGAHSASPSLSTTCPCSCSCSGDVSDAEYACSAHPTRGGRACAYPAVAGVQVEANDVARSGRVQLDVGAAGVQRGYGHRRRRAHTVAGSVAGVNMGKGRTDPVYDTAVKGGGEGRELDVAVQWRGGPALASPPPTVHREEDMYDRRKMQGGSSRHGEASVVDMERDVASSRVAPTR
ncbi:hypothetical protein B0H14DRAFT_3156579 [Mycena olivaceomarginata]|nr:hypothetical protein B0H14DRAFT_3156579 [Mycena olivaceomarginata]